MLLHLKKRYGLENRVHFRSEVTSQEQMQHAAAHLMVAVSAQSEFCKHTVFDEAYYELLIMT